MTRPHQKVLVLFITVVAQCFAALSAVACDESVGSCASSLQDDTSLMQLNRGLQLGTERKFDFKGFEQGSVRGTAPQYKKVDNMWVAVEGRRDGTSNSTSNSSAPAPSSVGDGPLQPGSTVVTAAMQIEGFQNMGDGWCRDADGERYYIKVAMTCLPVASCAMICAAQDECIGFNARVHHCMLQYSRSEPTTMMSPGNPDGGNLSLPPDILAEAKAAEWIDFAAGPIDPPYHSDQSTQFRGRYMPAGAWDRYGEKTCANPHAGETGSMHACVCFAKMPTLLNGSLAAYPTALPNAPYNGTFVAVPQTSSTTTPIPIITTTTPWAEGYHDNNQGYCLDGQNKFYPAWHNAGSYHDCEGMCNQFDECSGFAWKPQVDVTNASTGVIISSILQTCIVVFQIHEDPAAVPPGWSVSKKGDNDNQADWGGIGHPHGGCTGGRQQVLTGGCANYTCWAKHVALANENGMDSPPPIDDHGEWVWEEDADDEGLQHDANGNPTFSNSNMTEGEAYTALLALCTSDGEPVKELSDAEKFAKANDGSTKLSAPR